MVGPKPPGEPGVMLANAGRLKALASEIDAQASSLRATKASGAGPFADRSGGDGAGDAQRLQQAADSLEEAAGALKTGAAQVKAAQSAWSAKVKQVAGQLEHEARPRS